MEHPAAKLMADDLARSGLVPADIQARVMETPERGASQVAHSTQGYVIPYFDINGQREPFYRLRIFEDHEVLEANGLNGIKYKQGKNTQNHVYFPPNFKAALAKSNRRWLFLVEGEKKAAAATKAGFPCVALGGVDSWKSNTLVLPADLEMNTKDDKLLIKLPDGVELNKTESTYAKGFEELIDLIKRYDLKLFIVYDTDLPSGCRPEVQRAAYALGMALRMRDIPTTSIRQLVLPHTDPKTGLDDFLVAKNGAANFTKLININLEKRVTFPRHPDIKNYLRRKLGGKLHRDKQIELSTAVTVQLDTDGKRIFSDGDRPWYFDDQAKKLIKVEFNELQDPSFAATQWGRYIHQKFGLGQPDAIQLRWLNTSFMADPPIERSRMHRVIARNHHDDDSVTFQLSDHQYCVVDAEGLHVYDNGANGIMFAADEQLQPIDPSLLHKAYNELLQQPITPWWREVFEEVRLKDPDHDVPIGTLLYYTSPWLNRWRGTQLPVEMTLGEAGSGKSTLYTLRLNILTGHAALRNVPNDIRDWYASVANTGGFHVTDNVQMGDKGLKQRLSDDLCRLVTEPYPTIEMRELYTTDKQVKLPVNCVFGFTAIQQPFQNADIFQRAIIIELDKTKALKDGRNIEYDMNWMQRHLEKVGGRTYWLAHHFVVLTAFFRAVQKSWNPYYRAEHRLTNLEQVFNLMGQVLGIKVENMVKQMTAASTEAIMDTDWVYKGLAGFVEYFKTASKPGDCFSCAHVTDWAMAQEEFAKSEVLTNSFRLAKYMRVHAADLQMKLGIKELDRKVQNAKVFKII